MSAASRRVERQCLAKKPYESVRHAAVVAKRCRDSRGETLSVYQRPHCGAFHLTRMKRLSSADVAKRKGGWKR
jgi:hypothetical protein